MTQNRRFRGSPGLFHEWIAWCFVDSTVIGIRRQLKNRSKQNRCVSLRGALEEVRKYPELVTRAHYLNFHAEYPAIQLEAANRAFDRVAGVGGTQIKLSVVGRDIRRLKAKTLSRVEAWADRRAAHWHDGKVAAGTFSDLRRGLKTVERVLRRYLVLVAGNAPATLVPTIQLDWQELLSFAWAPRDEA